MNERKLILPTEAFGHFSRKGRIEVRGDHQRFERSDVVISFIEGKHVQDESALHIYLTPKEARALARAINQAARICKPGRAP